MGRTGQAQDQTQSAAAQANLNAENANVLADQAKFSTDASTLAKGGNIGANPYTNPDYLRNQNMIAATTADAADNADKSQLESTTRRTGLNSASLGYTTADMSRNKTRALTDYMAGLNNQNYGNNLAWQQYLLGNDMGTAGVANTSAGVATSGLNNANSNLTQLGLASYGPVNSLIQGLGSAVGGYFEGKGKCWIAAAVFDGWDDPRTSMVRTWLNTEFVKSAKGKLVMAAYGVFGKPVAFFVRHSEMLKRLFGPLFDRALGKAVSWERQRAVRKIACAYS